MDRLKANPFIKKSWRELNCSYKKTLPKSNKTNEASPLLYKRILLQKMVAAFIQYLPHLEPSSTLIPGRMQVIIVDKNLGKPSYPLSQ